MMFQMIIALKYVKVLKKIERLKFINYLRRGDKRVL